MSELWPKGERKGLCSFSCFSMAAVESAFICLSINTVAMTALWCRLLALKLNWRQEIRDVPTAPSLPASLSHSLFLSLFLLKRLCGEVIRRQAGAAVCPYPPLGVSLSFSSFTLNVLCSSTTINSHIQPGTCCHILCFQSYPLASSLWALRWLEDRSYWLIPDHHRKSASLFSIDLDSI